MEAMMRGLPVIASDVGGIPELITHGQTGLLVPPGDADAFRSALLSVLHNRSFAESIGAAAREEALGRFGIDRCVDAYFELYEELKLNHRIRG
jgi:glycosyltransferase involved in cell wall biosynthesis